MSTFNIGTIKTATISLGNGENVNVKELSVSIDGKLIVDTKEISMKIENGILLIKTLSANIINEKEGTK